MSTSYPSIRLTKAQRDLIRRHGRTPSHGKANRGLTQVLELIREQNPHAFHSDTRKDLLATRCFYDEPNPARCLYASFVRPFLKEL